MRPVRQHAQDLVGVHERVDAVESAGGDGASGAIDRPGFRNLVGQICEGVIRGSARRTRTRVVRAHPCIIPVHFDSNHVEFTQRLHCFDEDREFSTRSKWADRVQTRTSPSTPLVRRRPRAYRPACCHWEPAFHTRVGRADWMEVDR